MSLITNKKLPAFSHLKHEAIFEISLERAAAQDIRPIEIGILNLMPSAVVERTELQLLRLLANTPLQIRPTFLYFDEYKSNSKQSHFDTFYKTLSEAREHGLDGLIVTGANLEEYDFEHVRYWHELTSFLDWAHENITSTIFSCWAVHAALYHRYGVKPRSFEKKRFGVFSHHVLHETNSPFLFGMDDEILVPHSRWRGVEKSDVAHCPELEVLIESEGVGPHLICGRGGRELYLQGHPEYDRIDIAAEYLRDKAAGVAISLPRNYFPDDDESKVPLRNWSANAQVFYSNWINWIYQTTNVDVKKPLME
ncbi:MAG: homoserine O-succinyltransferase [Candidatus Paceibacterota bacterium]